MGDSKTAVIADVDCTVHQDLCGQHGVEGYPTIKYGDPNNMEDYQGGRELEDLQTFAKENLGPSCGPITSTCAMRRPRRPSLMPRPSRMPTSTPRSRRRKTSLRRPRRTSRMRSRSSRKSMRSSRRRRMTRSLLSRRADSGCSSRLRPPRHLARRRSFKRLDKRDMRHYHSQGHKLRPHECTKKLPLDVKQRPQSIYSWPLWIEVESWREDHKASTHHGEEMPYTIRPPVRCVQCDKSGERKGFVNHGKKLKQNL